jgi:uncharacterized UBP type Zn finger protein
LYVQRKEAKLHNPIKMNKDNLINVKREASRYFMNKKREYLKDKINKLESNSKNKNTIDLYKGVTEFKKGYQPRTRGVIYLQILIKF